MDIDMDSLDNHSRTIIHIDLDCFYAQVEMIKNPNLRNLPLGIQQKNIVVTSNYVAREFGIKKCMLVSEAKKLCPNLVLVKGEDLHDYRQISYKVTNLLQKYSSLVERLGLDENYVDVTNLVSDKLKSCERNVEIVGHAFGDISELCDCGCSNRLKIGTVIAEELRDLLKSELGLSSCAGIAHNKLLAKVVGAKNKPNQQTVVFPNSAVELLLSLELARNIPGIGTVLSEQLNSFNIKTIKDLQVADFSKLKNILGPEKAKFVYDLSYGIDQSLVKATGRPQSIGIEDSCKSISVEKEVREKLKQLLYRLLILVQEDGRVPKTIKLTVRKFDKSSKVSNRETKQTNLNSSAFNSKNLSELSETAEDKIMTTIMFLFSKLVDVAKPFHITLLGLSFTKFLSRANPLNSIATFLKKDIEVQSVTNIENVNGMKAAKLLTLPSTSTSATGFEPDAEPFAKKFKFDKLVAKRCLGNDSDDCASPSKLRVAELRLSSTDSNQDVSCPPSASEEVFRELPREVQKELWEDYKQQRDRDKVMSTSSQLKKSRPNSILNYFVRN